MLIYSIRERIIMRRFKGFTLTELMVALAVIGILVAVVTPAIMKNRPNKNKMMVKKSFYTVEQIVNAMINDEALYPDMTNFCGPAAEAGHECTFGFDDTGAGSMDGITYDGTYKFVKIFKAKLNVKSDFTGNPNCAVVSPGGVETYPIFYTTDGIKWNLCGTRAGIADASNWHPGRNSVGTFDEQNGVTAGIGIINIDVNGEEGPNAECTAANEDCDQYQVQILANGKLRINPDHERAVNYATINTSLKDD